MTKAFQEIRVIDLSNRLSGAYAARMFGDFGAEVILIEQAQGHPLRHQPPFMDGESGTRESLLHGYVNWNKRSVSGSIEDHVSLIATADVIVTHTVPAGGVAAFVRLGASIHHPPRA